MMIDQVAARRTMVDTQLRTYDVNAPVVLDAIERVDRRVFLSAASADFPYLDRAEVIEAGGTHRTLLVPMVLARMIQAVEIRRGDRVLTIAGGTGYGAAVAAAIGADVTALEETQAMAGLARAALDAAGFGQVATPSGSLTAGYPAGAPYDVILVEGAVETVPDVLLNQLQDGGRLIAVFGTGRSARVVIHTRAGDVFGSKAAFDAAAAPIAAFAAPRGFQF